MAENSEDHNGGIDPKLLELLVCPLTKTRLRFDRENSELISEVAKLAYPVRGGVPILLPSEARRLDGSDIRADSNSD